MDRFPERSALSSKVKSSTSLPPITARGAMAMPVKSQRRHRPSCVLLWLQMGI